MEFIEDFSAVPSIRFSEAQTAERDFWDSQDRVVLTLQANYYFYAAYYEWTEHRALLNPFRRDPTRPANFQLSADDIAGAAVLDIGCGPTSQALSLVHCATVHAVDPLVDHYRELQPFGWDHFRSVLAAGAEELPFETASIDVVHSRNVLDHTRHADQILDEAWRVLRPGGQLLLKCDVRGERGGGPAHPYRWSREVLEKRVFAQFEPVTSVSVTDAITGMATEGPDSEQARWVCRLRRRDRPSRLG